MDRARILIIDDEPEMLEACEEALTHRGYDVAVTLSASEALELVRDDGFDLVLIDLKMPEMDGIEILNKIKLIDRRTVAVMITGFPTIGTAVEAIKGGAFDYLPKPFSPDQLLIVVERALEQKRLADENLMLRRQLKSRAGFEAIVAKSRAMDGVFELMSKVADSDSNILIEGESGTGKELIARCIHQNSHRREAHFVPIDCSALPENLLESELFGHERGAFTGAYTRKLGLLETAQGGSVLLDEVSELSPNLQAKLLRFLQERQIRRVGGGELIDVDVRIISATNANLQRRVAMGSFREDLFYRLNVITISVPPLRQRIDDIPVLAWHFLLELNKSHSKEVNRISPQALEILQNYFWPGNVRELQNVIERAFLLTDSDTITAADLSGHLVNSTEAGPSLYVHLPFVEARRLYTDSFEKRYLERALSECGGNVSRAAEKIGLNRTSFHRLMKKHGIRPKGLRKRLTAVAAMRQMSQ